MILLLLLLAGCPSWLHTSVPDEAREFTADERTIVVEHVERWERIIGPLGECRQYADRLRVIDGDDATMLRWCHRANVNGCPAQRGGVGLIIARIGLSPVGHADIIGHEATHLLGHCSRPTGHDWIGHSDPALWGPDGVHPL